MSINSSAIHPVLVATLKGKFLDTNKRCIHFPPPGLLGLLVAVSVKW